MSIENNLASIATSLAAIAAHLTKQQVTAPTPIAPVTQAQTTQVPVLNTPVTNGMPPPPFAPNIPTFLPAAQAPAPAAPQQPVAPFTDQKGLVTYVMGAYQAMGANKGAGIQGVLQQLGYQNINDVQPAHYGALFAGVEGLK